MKTKNYKSILKAMLIVAYLFALCGTTISGEKIRIHLVHPRTNQLGESDLWNMEVENTTDKSLNRT